MFIKHIEAEMKFSHFTNGILKIFLNDSVWTLLKISPKFLPEVRINNIGALIR